MGARGHAVMLRKTLLARLGLLVVGFVAGAVIAITLLQGVLTKIDAMKADASAVIDGVIDLTMAAAAVEAQSDAAARGQAADPGRIEADLARVHSILNTVASHPLIRDVGAGGPEAVGRVRALLPDNADASPILRDSTALRGEIAGLARVARRQIAAEQIAISKHLRVLIIALTIAALVMVNVSVFVLMRTAGLILEPVSRLLEGSRLLAQERFDHRVTVARNDEFAELAHAYNRLADGLAANEQRKVQALRHLAVTLNHELNNVLGIIDLRLELMNRASKGDPALATHLNEVRQNLGRMARTIASLREVRRIVLTEYMPGEQMIDLSRSVAPEDSQPTFPAGADVKQGP